MKRWRWGSAIILGILLAAPLVVSGVRRHPTEGPAHTRHGVATQVMTTYQADVAPMWSPQWVDDGIPRRFRQSGGVPSVVADPANPQLTWWFWPQISHGQVWFGLDQGQGVAWHGGSVGHMAQWSTLPVPVRATARWVTALQSDRGPIPEMRIEPAGAFLADLGSVTGATGWDAAMELPPRTIIVTWGLAREHGAGLRLITLWHWQPRSRWQCTLVILQNEPTARWEDTGRLSEMPSQIPGWAVYRHTNQGGRNDGTGADARRGVALR